MHINHFPKQIRTETTKFWNQYIILYYITIIGIMPYQFGVGPPLYPCCSSHVPLLYIFCPPVVPLMCSCSASLVPLVTLLLFSSSSTLLLPFTWGYREGLKMPYGGTLLSLFCPSEPYKITLFKRNSHPRELFWCKTSWQSWLPKPIYYVKLFSLLGDRAIMWGWVNIGSTSSPATPHKGSMVWLWNKIWKFRPRSRIYIGICLVFIRSCGCTAP